VVSTYPKLYNEPDYLIYVGLDHGGVHQAIVLSGVAGLPRMEDWPTMLGLLTIISDAIAAAPWWGGGESSPELPAVGSVWVRKDGIGLPATVVTHGNPPGTVIVRSGEEADDGGWVTGGFLYAFTPATVVPTDEYQSMKRHLEHYSHGAATFFPRPDASEVE
jgi:hypothetical protein